MAPALDVAPSEEARLTGWRRSLVLGLARGIVGLARHWPALIGAFWALYLATALAAPALMRAGRVDSATLLYRAHRLNCHQLAHRSFFLFGPQLEYSLEELARQGPIDSLQALQDFVGNEALGYKVAICQRDLAIYGSILLAGLAYAGLRDRARAIPWFLYLILVVPIALDSLTQLVGLRESNWAWRLGTGALFGASTAWLAYPLVDRLLGDIGGQAQRQLERAARQPGGRRQGQDQSIEESTR